MAKGDKSSSVKMPWLAQLEKGKMMKGKMPPEKMPMKPMMGGPMPPKVMPPTAQKAAVNPALAKLPEQARAYGLKNMQPPKKGKK